MEKCQLVFKKLLLLLLTLCNCLVLALYVLCSRELMQLS